MFTCLVFHAGFVIEEGIEDRLVVTGVQSFDAGSASAVFGEDEPNGFLAELLCHSHGGILDIDEQIFLFEFCHED